LFSFFFSPRRRRPCPPFSRVHGSLLLRRKYDYNSPPSLEVTVPETATIPSPMSFVHDPFSRKNDNQTFFSLPPSRDESFSPLHTKRRWITSPKPFLRPHDSPSSFGRIFLPTLQSSTPLGSFLFFGKRGRYASSSWLDFARPTHIRQHEWLLPADRHPIHKSSLRNTPCAPGSTESNPARASCEGLPPPSWRRPFSFFSKIKASAITPASRRNSLSLFRSALFPPSATRLLLSPFIAFFLFFLVVTRRKGPPRSRWSCTFKLFPFFPTPPLPSRQHREPPALLEFFSSGIDRCSLTPPQLFFPPSDH